MELFSPSFRETAWQIIKSGKKILGTIILNSHPWADEIKSYPDVNLITVTRDNNKKILKEIVGWLGTSGD
jgi:nucleoside-triphosphatase THEP1